MSFFDSLEFMKNPIAKNQDQAISREVDQAYPSRLTTKLGPNSSIHSQMCYHILLRVDTSRHILQTNLFPKIQSLTFILSVLTYSSDLVRINKYAHGNQQHYLINKVRNYHEKVEKAVADFLAAELKEYW